MKVTQDTIGRPIELTPDGPRYSLPLPGGARLGAVNISASPPAKAAAGALIVAVEIAALPSDPLIALAGVRVDLHRVGEGWPTVSLIAHPHRTDARALLVIDIIAAARLRAADRAIVARAHPRHVNVVGMVPVVHSPVDYRGDSPVVVSDPFRVAVTGNVVEVRGAPREDVILAAAQDWRGRVTRRGVPILAELRERVGIRDITGSERDRAAALAESCHAALLAGLGVE